MPNISIQEIQSHHLHLYRDFFNAGLLNDADNFRMTVADVLQAPFPTKDSADSFTLGAYVDKTLTGIISFERDGIDREKLRHKGLLFRMYVSGNFRGQGIGKLLIKTLIDNVRKLNDVEQINLTVVSHNLTAKKLYESFGFKTFSIEHNAQKWKGKYFTEETMALKL